MALIETTNLVVNLTPKPIEPSWIIEGNPVAQWSVLSKSADGLATTIVWECSEGRFNWYYDFDETILILEGSIVLENDTMRPTRYGKGDVIFFRNGAHARWYVEGRVRSSPSAGPPSPWCWHSWRGLQQDQARRVSVREARGAGPGLDLRKSGKLQPIDVDRRS